MVIGVCVFKEVGIDYITATKHPGASSSPFVDFANWVVSEEVAQGCERRNYRAQGYRGSIAGRAAVGTSRQGHIARFSSEVASEHWAQLLNLSDNVTRLDVQVTLLPVTAVQETLRRHHKELLGAGRRRGKPLVFDAHYGPVGPTSIEVGSRKSDRFLRVYDKGCQSGEARYDGTLRYEAEYHRKLALAVALALDASDSQEADMVGLLYQLCSDRELAPSGWGNRPELSSIMLRDRTDSEELIPELNRSLKWLHNSVAPCVRRLVQAGRLGQVLEALDLSDVVQVSPFNAGNLRSGPGGREREWLS